MLQTIKKILAATPITALLDGARGPAELADAIAQAAAAREDQERLTKFNVRRSDALLADDFVTNQHCNLGSSLGSWKCAYASIGRLKPEYESDL